MNQIATQQPKVPMSSVSVSDTGRGTKIAPKDLNEVVKFAEVMCRADIALPKHLRGNAGACMAVAMQALEWELSPFAVASKSYAVNGAIAYEAQLIAAVVNTRSGIKGRLRYQFDGEGGSLTCTVTGVLDGEECVYTSPPIGSITTKNSPLWKSDPQQQLGYFSARSWARRHCPEVILGVYDRDETEQFQGSDNAKNITPSFDPFADDAIVEPRKAHNALDDDRAVTAQPEAKTAPVLDHDDFNNTGSPSQADQPDTDEDRDASSLSSSEEDAGVNSPSIPASSDDQERLKLIRYARDVLPKAADPDANGNTLKAIENRWADDIAKLSDEGRMKAKGIAVSMRAIFNGSTSLESAAEFYAEALETTVGVILGREEV